MSMRLAALALVSALAAVPSGASAQKRIAVLEFRAPGTGACGTGAESPTLAARCELVSTLSDAARSGALAAFKQAGDKTFVVMTREAIAVMLKDMGRSTCVDGECEVEVGRNIGADIVVSGQVAVLDETYLVTLKLHETAHGTLLETREVEAKKQLEAVRAVKTATTVLVSNGLALAAPAAVAVTPATATPTAAAEPPAAPEPPEDPGRFRRWYLEVRGGLPLSAVGPVSDAEKHPNPYPEGRLGFRISEGWAIDLGVGGGSKIQSPVLGTGQNTNVDIMWFLASAAWAPIPSFRNVSVAVQVGSATVGVEYQSPRTGDTYRENATALAAGVELRLDLPLGNWSLGLRSGWLTTKPSVPSDRSPQPNLTLIPDFGKVSLLTSSVAAQYRF